MVLGRRLLAVGAALALGHITIAQQGPVAGAETEIYKRIGEVKLQMHLLLPEGHDRKRPRPAVVFFFGGGWNGGRIGQFEPQARHLAARGVVTALADYRVKSRHRTTPFECVADGRSAVRWLRTHAKRLGIDPNRIAAAGGSAGGHVAAATGVIDDPEPAGKGVASSRPDALLLFNPVFDNGPGGYGHDRLGKRWRELSPLHHVDEQAPPTIVFLGTKDKLVPVSAAKAYQAAMRKVDRRCDLQLYPGQPHGFFNRERNAKAYADTMKQTDRFLAELGWIEAAPTDRKQPPPLQRTTAKR